MLAILIMGLLVLAPNIMALVKGRRIDFFSPWACFPAFYFMIFGIGSIGWVEANYDNSVNAVILSIVGITSYYLGVLIATHRITFEHRAKGIINRWHKKRVILASTFLLLLGFAAFSIVLYVVGIPMLSDQVLEKEVYRQQVSSYVLFLLRLIPNASLLLFTYVWSQKNMRLSTSQIIVIFIISLVCLMAGSRNIFLLFIVSLIIIYHYSVRPIKIKKAIILSAAVIIGLVIIAFTRAIRSEIIPPSMAHVENVVGDDNLLRMFGFYMVLNVSSYVRAFMDVLSLVPNTLDYYHGKIVLLTLATFLPGKQHTYGEILKVELGLTFPGGGVNPTILGEAYSDFGVIGIVFMMFVYGVILGNGYKRLLSRRNTSNVIIYSFLYSTIILGTLTGIYSTAMYMFNGVVIFSMLLIIRSRVGFSRLK